MALAKIFYTVKNITYIYKIDNFANDTTKINPNSTKDIYKGLKECLDLCEKYKLYCKIAKRINENWFLDIVKNHINNNETIYIISNILMNLNQKILKSRNVSIIINDYYINLLK